MAMHSQPLTSSWLCRLPRLIPAPQALLKSSRPFRLPTAKGVTVMGVYGGTMVDELNYFANLFHDVESVASYEFRSYEIKYQQKPQGEKEETEKESSLATTLNTVEETPEEKEEDAGRKPTANNLLPLNTQDLDGSRPSTPNQTKRASESSINGHEGRYGSPKARSARSERNLSPGDRTTHDTTSPPPPKRRGTNLSNISPAPILRHQTPPPPPADPDMPLIPTIPSRTFSPLNILTVFSFLLLIGLLIWAGLIHDGVAVIALCTISSGSSVICYASEWEPTLARRPTSAPPIPNGDVVIRTRGAAFIVIKCPEEIARELYTGTEKCNYLVGEQLYRILVGVGTVLFMVSVVLLGNCEWTMQAAIGAAFILLNGLYWGVALMPPALHWDMTRYTCEETTPLGLRNAHDPQHNGMNASFTRTLWYAIQHTREVKWIADADMAPKHTFWSEWMRQALQEARKGNPDWPAVEKKNELMKEFEERDRKSIYEGRRMSIVDEEGITSGTAGSPTKDQNRLIVRGAGENVVG